MFKNFWGECPLFYQIDQGVTDPPKVLRIIEDMTYKFKIVQLLVKGCISCIIIINSCYNKLPKISGLRSHKFVLL